MNPISITVTGRLGDDPRTFTTRDGTDGVELRLALDIPARGAGEGITRWIKVTAFGLLAIRTGESVRKGDRVTVVADDLIAEAWAATGTGEHGPQTQTAVSNFQDGYGMNSTGVADPQTLSTLAKDVQDSQAAQSGPPETASPARTWTRSVATGPSSGIAGDDVRVVLEMVTQVRWPRARRQAVTPLPMRTPSPSGNAVARACRAAWRSCS